MKNGDIWQQWKELNSEMERGWTCLKKNPKKKWNNIPTKFTAGIYEERVSEQ